MFATCLRVTDYRSMLALRFVLPIMSGSPVSQVKVFPVPHQTLLPNVYGSGIIDLASFAVDVQNHRRFNMNV